MEGPISSKQEFIDALELVVRTDSINGELKRLKRPAGRAPAEELVRRSEWFNGLDERDRIMLGEVVATAVDAAIFATLCLIDGASVIDSCDPHGELKLTYQQGDNEAVCLNDFYEGDDLHDIYRASAAWGEVPEGLMGDE